MRVLVFLLMAVLVAQGRRAQEARCYVAPLAGFYELPVGLDGVLDEPERLELGEMAEVEKAGFTSRFLGEGQRLRDLTGWAHRMMPIEENDHMIWNETSNRLVVWTDEEGHRETEIHFSQFLNVTPKSRVEVLKSGKKVGEDGELEAEMNDLSLEGHVRWYAGVKLRSRIEGAEFEFDGDCVGCPGVPLVIGLGSPEGKDSFSVKVTVEGLLDDGTPVQQWAIKEDGSSAWWEESLREQSGPWQDPGLDQRERVRRRMIVPPSSREFLVKELANNEPNPFGEKMSPKEFLRQNAVGFREGDWAVYYRKSGVLEVCVDPAQLFSVEGAFGHSDPGFGGMIRFDFWQVDSNGETLKTIGLLMLEGSGSVGLGEDFKVEVEGVYEWVDESVELRVALTEVGDLERASFRTRLKVAAGEPVEVLRSFDG